jgi:MFS family permease
MLLRLYQSWLNSYLGIPQTIWFLAIVNLINRCGGLVIGFIALYMTQHLQIGIEKAGYAMSCYGVGTLIGVYLGGRLSDRFGYFGVMLVTLAGNGLILLAILLARDFYTVCAMVFLLGLIGEAFRPANSVSIVRNSTPETFTRSISLYRMSANIGWAIAPVLAGTLVFFGWHWLFIVDGLTCITAAGFLLFYRKHLNLKVPTQQQENQEQAVVEVPEQKPLRDAPFRWFLLLTVLNAVVFMQLLWTIPIFFKEVFLWNEQQIGLIVALNGLIVFLVEMPLIFRIEGKRSNLGMIGIGLILYMLAYLSLILPWYSTVAALFFIFFISIGEIFVMPFSSNFTMQRAGQKNQGQYTALYIMGYSMANTLAPLFGTQIIAALGWSVLWAIIMVLALFSWVGCRLLEKRIHFKTKTQKEFLNKGAF